MIMNFSKGVFDPAFVQTEQPIINHIKLHKYLGVITIRNINGISIDGILKI